MRDATAPPAPARERARPFVVAVIVGVLAVVAWRQRDALVALLEWARGAGTAGIAAFTLAYVVSCIVFLPGLILTMAAGLIYGVGLGVPIVWVAATLGSTAAFLLGRTFARGLIERRVRDNARFAAIDRAVAREGLKIVFLTRLSPIFPFNLLNYAYGLTSVTLRDYVLGAFGMIPGTLLYVYLGSLATSLDDLAAGTPEGGAAAQSVKILGFAATVAVTVVVTRIARRALEDATRDADGTTLGGDAPEGGAGHLAPNDEHDRTLVSHVQPAGHRNPIPSGRYNLVVVGAGTAGLVSAAGAAGLGAKVALVERHRMGGDCLNVGCVPSKGLIGAARIAAAARGANEFGVDVAGVSIDFPAVMARMRRLRAGFAPMDGVERFTDLGVDVFLGQGTFTSPSTLEVDGTTLEFSRAVIATGARAGGLPIPGLTEAGFHTNETIFSLTEQPRRLAVIGGGPIGCELAQAFERLGTDVTLLNDVPHLLPREDADAAAIIERRLAADGVTILNGAHTTRVESADGGHRLHVEHDGTASQIDVDAILVSVGRTPNVDGLGLEAAGVSYDDAGITVDDRLRTTNPRIFAAGDVASQFKFTHAADAQARLVLRNALFWGRRKASNLTVPWCTYTSPEVAHIGLYEDDARARGIDVTTITIPLADVDRAVLDGESDGFLKVHVGARSDKIVGATLVAAHAGDMIGEIAVAMAGGVGLGTIAETIHPYPTQAEVLKKAADAYNRTRLTPTVKRLFERVLAWRR